MSRFVTTKKSDIQLNVEYLRNQKLSLFEPAEDRFTKLTWNDLKHLYPKVDDEFQHKKLLYVWNYVSPYSSFHVRKERKETKDLPKGFVNEALEIVIGKELIDLKEKEEKEIEELKRYKSLKK